jgi:glutamate racemase
VIGILDSGLGGLAAVASLRSHLPHYDFIYFGDTVHGPFGEKSEKAVARYALEGARFLTTQSVRLILLTSSGIDAAARNALTNDPSIPVFGPVGSGAAEAAARSRKGAVGVIGSPLTVHSRAYPEAFTCFDGGIRVHQAACPLLPPLVAEGRFNKPETTMIIRKYLLPLKHRQIDALILGEPHYLALYRPIGRKAGKRVALIDPFAAMARSVRRFLEGSPEFDARLPQNGGLRVLLSDLCPGAEKTARRLLGRHLTLEPAAS